MRKFKQAACLFMMLWYGGLPANAQMKNTLPYLVKAKGACQLMVNDKPFLLLGGELGNSSASDIAYMRPVWPKLAAMHLNTVLVPVYWELMEPEEGRFDFMLVDSMIASAREYDLRLVLLWFGSWKNSMSCYAPEWIKTNQGRFERATDSRGRGMEILSAFNEENLRADCKAFSALMRHISQTDAATQTVIMIQVENEIGMLGEAREYTATANAAFNKNVPPELIAYLQKNKDVLVPELRQLWEKSGFATSGAWEEVFGKGLATDELFQAWQYAKYTNTVAASGREEYSLPMYVNAALNYKNVKPGAYPSAGPLPHLMDIWQAGAPWIDILSPDFYNPRFTYYNDLFVRRDNPLFIPEIRLEPSNAAKVFYALGHYKAIGFSPFSIESAGMQQEEVISKSYDILRQLAPAITASRSSGRMEGVLLDTVLQRKSVMFGAYKLSVAHDYTLGWSSESKKPGWPESGVLILQTGADEFTIAGSGIVVSFSSVEDTTVSVGILKAEEGHYANGKWQPGRRMNGDQDHQGRHIRIPAGEFGIQRVKLYQYR